ncbi:sugar transferase [Brevundimonas phoenicis]|uniref:sugar transferase n=2 Tax=unclassified Brevundimonas TaxID=2622653 RepID=UPI00399F40AD
MQTSDAHMIERPSPGGAYASVKRGVDIFASLSAIIVLSPVLLVTALLVWLRLGSPILFRQLRPGLHERPFEMIKFRSMRDAVDADGRPLPDMDRLTSFGRWLRSTSLDELPELWNVLKGDMSLVGPRPLLMEYLDYYTDEERIRHSVRPGLTGLSQINGRNSATWEEKFSMDSEYVQRHSFLLDITIILKTLKKILTRDDILDRAPQGSLSSYRSRQQENV